MEGACIVATTVVGPVYRPVDASMVYRGLRTLAAEFNLICEEITNMATLESMTLDIIRDGATSDCFLNRLIFELLSLWFRPLTWGCFRAPAPLFSRLHYKVRNLLLEAGFYERKTLSPYAIEAAARRSTKDTKWLEDDSSSDIEENTDSPSHTIKSEAMEKLLEDLHRQIGT